MGNELHDRLPPKFRALMETYEMTAGAEADFFLEDGEEVWKTQWMVGSGGDPSVGIPSVYVNRVFNTKEELIEWANSPEGYQDLRKTLTDIFGESEVARDEKWIEEDLDAQG